MIDLRPVGYVVGLIVVALGLSMVGPAAMDLWDRSGNWAAFAVSGLLTVAGGGALAIACRAARRPGLTIRETFLLTNAIWLVSCVFAALPMMLGAPRLGAVDAFFESMSGITTTGATVIAGLDGMPRGLLLWRALLQWYGGIGIIVVALAFLPALRVGGMQLFRSEGFETFGKLLPRAAKLGQSIGGVYVILTALCAMAYHALGMAPFDAVTHAMTTIATGGFANYDSSFAAFEPGLEYASVLFMTLACLPFVRFVQLAAGSARPLLRDSQVRAFLGFMGGAAVLAAGWRAATTPGPFEPIFRQTLFNVVSVITGTGYASEDYALWGPLPVTLLFIGGLVGGCSGSATCALKVFRMQVLWAAIVSQVRRIHSSSGVFRPRYEGRPIDDETIASVMSFLYFYALTLGVIAVALSMMGLSPITAVTGAATALACIGPGFGPEIGPAGNFVSQPDLAKVVLALTMLLGRLELVSVLVLFRPGFWRD